MKNYYSAIKYNYRVSREIIREYVAKKLNCDPSGVAVPFCNSNEHPNTVSSPALVVDSYFRDPLIKYFVMVNRAEKNGNIYVLTREDMVKTPCFYTKKGIDYQTFINSETGEPEDRPTSFITLKCWSFKNLGHYIFK